MLRLGGERRGLLGSVVGCWTGSELAGGMEVFATNVARACRDETDLIVESTPDGRSKRYRLTDAGKAAAAGLSKRPL